MCESECVSVCVHAVVSVCVCECVCWRRESRLGMVSVRCPLIYAWS